MTKRQKEKKTNNKDQKENLILCRKGSFALLQCFFYPGCEAGGEEADHCVGGGAP